MIRIAFLCIIQLAPIQMDMEPFVVGGQPAKIEYFSHSAYLSVQMNPKMYYCCGASILNQNVLLSAAHCFENVNSRTKLTVRAGSANKWKGAVRTATKIAVHQHYDPDSIMNDIALIYVKQPFVLGNKIKRVILMKTLPKTKLASVAGWGVIEESAHAVPDWLQYTQQKLWVREECMKILGEIPYGTFCAGRKYSEHYVSTGDSGSALVVDGKIQVGLVSFKRPRESPSLSVYTSVPYFYNWIVQISKKISCAAEV